MPAFIRLRRRLSRHRANGPDRPDSGFTLVELVVALLLLAIIMSASLYALLQGLGLSRDNQERVVASNLVSGVLEKLETSTLSSTGFNTVAASVGTTALANQTVAGTTFHFTQTNEWESRGATSSVCSSGTNTNLVLVVTVKATWGYGGESVSESTTMAPPSGSVGTTGDGALAVQVDQSGGAGFSGATVTATNSSTNSTTSYTTGSDGCAFFDSLTPGNYNVSVSSPGGVSIGEASTYQTTSSLKVSSPGVNTSLAGTAAIYYETGGTVTWSYSQPYSSTPLIPAEGMPISVDNPSQGLNNGANMYAFAAPLGASTSGTITPVYPNTYTIFAGGCTDADPNGVTTGGTHSPFYTNAASSAVVVGEGSTSTATVPLYPLNLQIENASGTPLLTAVSSPVTPPTAVAGGAGVCENQGTPTYTLNAVAAGVSSTAVGLGELQISATIVGQSSPATATVWVKPDGVYTTGGTEIYSFASCTTTPTSPACKVPVKL
jgi:prepilin-type N-terminal cleavage/methylation domain-containing protein